MALRRSAHIYKGNIIGGGSDSGGSLSELNDVTLTNVQDGQMLVYDDTTHKWINTDTGEAVEPLSNQDVNDLIAML